MKRAAVLPMIFVALLSAACSHLRVRTEVYRNPDPNALEPDGAPRRVAELATIAYQSLEGYEDRLASSATAEYRKHIETLKAELPDLFPLSTQVYVSEFASVIQNALDPVRKSGNGVRQLARQLGAAGGSGQAFKDVDNLVAGVAQLKLLSDAIASQAHAALEGIASTEISSYRDAVRVNYLISAAKRVQAKDGKVRTVTVFSNDAELEMRSGLKIADEKTRAVAIDHLVQRIENMTVRNDAVFRDELVAIARSVAATMPAVEIIPLHDANIPAIIASPQDHWKRYVNDVTSTTIFGNAEIAFRMDGLGDNHIKGVLFDPSEAIKAGLDVFSKALKVTAAAYGARLPSTASTGTGGGTSMTTDSAAISKPAIDAEIAAAEAATAARTERLQSLFWNVVAIARAAPADDAGAAPGVAKELISLAKCAGTDLIEGKVRKCGGQS
jgi:hypothetical protein